MPGKQPSSKAAESTTITASGEMRGIGVEEELVGHGDGSKSGETEAFHVRRDLEATVFSVGINK